MIDLDHFKDTYFEECSELLVNAENNLLALSESQHFSFPLSDANSDSIHALFRDIHSVKGGGGAFGFTQLVSFAHDMESLLDAIRSNQMPFNHDMLSLLIESRDGLAHLVNEAQKQDGNQESPLPPFISALSLNLVSALTTHLKNNSQTTPHMSSQTSISTALPEKQSSEKQSASSQLVSPILMKKFILGFHPHPDLLQSGNEPLYLFRELQQLGDCVFECDYHKIPDIMTLEHTQCYISWKITIKTDASQEDILDIFEFVENSSDIDLQLATAKTTVSKEVLPDTTNIPVTGIFSPPPSSVSMADLPISGEQLFKTTHAPISENIENSKLKKAISAQLYPSQKVQRPQQSSVRVHLDKIDTLVNLVGEIVIHQSMLMEQASYLVRPEADNLWHGLESLGQFTRELQDSVMAIRAQPIKTVFSRMTRIVHDISRTQNKSVQLMMIGDSCEVDKTIIEQLNDPLTHMIRNAVDHGIETEAERQLTNKPAKALISLKATQRKGRIVIEVSDDGRGLDKDKILKKAVERKLIKTSDNLSESEIYNLLFEPGFSTAQQVSDISGRGVGLDVVKKNINSMGGSLSIRSNLGEGTCFKLSLPLTLAVLDGMILRIGQDNFVLPLNAIVESLRPNQTDLDYLANTYPMLRVRGDYIPIIPLHQLFEDQTACQNPCDGLIVIIEDDDGTHIGLQIDDVLGQQQVVIKSLEDNFRPLPGISGATILGDGNVALIFDLPSLLQYWRKSLNSMTVLSSISTSTSTISRSP